MVAFDGASMMPKMTPGPRSAPARDDILNIGKQSRVITIQKRTPRDARKRLVERPTVKVAQPVEVPVDVPRESLVLAFGSEELRGHDGRERQRDDAEIMTAPASVKANSRKSEPVSPPCRPTVRRVHGGPA